MASSISVDPDSDVRDHGGKIGSLDRLPSQMNGMKLNEDKVYFLF